MATLKQHEDGTVYISNNWYVTDVESKCETMEVTLTEEEKVEVLDRVADSFDANYGITWDSFEYAIETVIEERTNA